MKTIAKSKKRAIKRRPVSARVKPAASVQLSAEEFRRRLHIELADEIHAAREIFKKTHGHLLRPISAAEAKARASRVRAMFAKWEEEYRKDPVSPEESASYDRMLERIRRERSG